MTSTTRSTVDEIGGVMVRVQERSRLQALPTWLLLGGIVAVSFLVRLVYALRDPAPWIFHDELAYSELAKSFGSTGAFAIRDVAGTGGFGVLYPMLIAPAFAVFDSIPSAYDALRVVNCLLVSLTAIPVYLIGRRIAGRWLSLAAAALSLAIPSLMYTGTVMTENAFYPVIAFFALALIRALEQPSVWRQVLVFVLVGLAFATRVQAIVLVPVIVTALLAVVLLDLANERGALRLRVRRVLYPFWPTLALLALGAAAIPVRQLLAGEPLTELLGAYGGITRLGYDWGRVAEYVLYHLAELDIALGVIPFAAFIAFTIWSLRPSVSRELRVFAAVGTSLVAWFVVVAAAYGSTPLADRIVERNLFHVFPFFFLALAGWIAHRCPRPWWAAAPAVVLAGALTLTLPLNSFLNGTIVHSTAGLMPVWRWRDRLFSASSIDEVVFVAAVLGALAFLLVPRPLAFLLPLALLVYFAAAARPVEGFTHGASVASYDFGVGKLPPDWIDRAVDGEVASFWWGGTTAVPYWESEFFNRSVKRTYTLTGAYDGLVHTFIHLRLLPSGLFVDGAGERVRQRYVLTDTGSRLVGRVVARNDIPGLVLYELEGPLRARERIEGLYADTWSGASVTYTRYSCRAGTLSLRLQSDPELHRRPVALTVSSPGGAARRLRVPIGGRRVPLAVPLRPRDGVCRAEFSVPTRSALVFGTNDQRQLGLRFLGLRYEPSR